MERKREAKLLFVCLFVSVWSTSRFKCFFGLPSCDPVKEAFGWMDPHFWGGIKVGNVDLEVAYK